MKTINRFLRRYFSVGLYPHTVTRPYSCAWCGKSGTWTGKITDAPPTFCTKTHRNKASKARKARQTSEPPKAKIAYSTESPRKCPHPEKLRFDNFDQAQRVINRVDPAMHPYRCRCGSIHIGH